MKVQSISDIITNSSSEVFIIEAQGYTAKSLKEELEKAINNNTDQCSGMGGELDVFSSKTKDRDADPEYDDLYPYEWLPEGFFAIDFDWGFKGLKKYITSHFKLVDIPDGRVIIDKNTKDVVDFYRSDEDLDEEKYKNVPGGLFEAEQIAKFYDQKSKDLGVAIQKEAEKLGYGDQVGLDKLRHVRDLMNLQCKSDLDAKYAKQNKEYLTKTYYGNSKHK